MGRFGTLIGTALLVGATALQAGCGQNGVGIITASNTSFKNEPPIQVFIPDIQGRPAEVAFISSCAQAYGFVHDAAKLRTAYLAYEAKRGAKPAQLSVIEKDYDATYRAIEDLGHRKSSFCSTKDGEQVRAELRRYTSGFFEAKSNSP